MNFDFCTEPGSFFIKFSSSVEEQNGILERVKEMGLKYIIEGNQVGLS